MNPERKSKTARAYETFYEAAGKLETYSETELKRIALAVNPELEEHELRMVIYNCHWWIDSDISLGGIESLGSGYLTSLYTLKRRLLFFREEVRGGSSSKLRNETRLILEFPWRNTKLWLDCETGRFWEPQVRLRNRRFLDAARQQELLEIDRAAEKLAAAERAKIFKELTELTGWIDQGADYEREARVEILSDMIRPNPKAEWQTVAQYATRYFPAGSNLQFGNCGREEAEAFRGEYLRKRGSREARDPAGEAPALPVTYPEHTPNHSVMQEVAA